MTFGMKINDNIFRAYDIRGKAYEELTSEIVKLIGQALGSKSLDQGQNSLVVGRDGRNSSPDMFEWLTSGINSSGCNVVNIGIVPTPMLYFATHTLSASNGVMITGSHNPKDYNGFKIVENKRSLSGDAIQDLKGKILQKDFQTGNGKKEEIDIKEEYIKFILDNTNIVRPLKIAIDCGNGAASVIAKEVYERLGCKVDALYSELDGNFPNHHPDPSNPKNLEDLSKIVSSKNLEIGLAFDGDADRLGVVSSDGKIIFPDKQMILFSRSILKEHKQGGIVFDVKCSKLLSDEIKKIGGTPIMSKTGHSFIKDCIQENAALLGGEMSGHIFFNDRWPGFDDGIYAGARMLEILSQQPEGENIFSDLPELFSTSEINIKTSDDEKFQIVKDFIERANYEGSDSILIDGIRVEFDYGWGLLRASNTSPNLVLRFEADSTKNLETLQKLFQKTLKEINPNLEDFT